MEQSVVAAVLEAAGPTRRQLLAGLGGAALATLIGEVFPLATLKAFAADPVGKPEKKDVSLGVHSHYVWNPHHHGGAVGLL